MKRLLCMAAAMAAVVMGVPAQTLQEEKQDARHSSNITLGVKAGVGGSLITGLPGDKNEGLAYTVGVTLDWYVSRAFSVSPELRLSHTATTVEGGYGTGVIDDAEFPLSLNYLELPVHAAFHIRLGGNFRIVMKIGPYLAYGVRGKTSVEALGYDFRQKMPGSLFSHGWDYGGVAYDSHNNRYALPRFKRWDYGVSSAVGLEFWRLAVSFDATLGCAHLTGSRVADNWEDTFENLLTLSRKPRRMSFMLSAGYKF